MSSGKQSLLLLVIVGWVLGFAGGIIVWAAPENRPATVEVEWPPWVDDVDGDPSNGKQPGYDLTAENNYDSRAVEDERQFRFHVKPPTDEDGNVIPVCDVHIEFPDGTGKFEPSSDEGVIVQHLTNWSGGKQGEKGTGFHFYSDCENPMEEVGLTFAFWTSDGLIDGMVNVEVVLTNDGSKETPEDGDDSIVGVVRDSTKPGTTESHPLKLPVNFAAMVPGDPADPPEFYANRMLVELGDELPLRLLGVHGDADYEFFTSRSLDESGTDPSGTGINAVTDPVPGSWGVEFDRETGWLNSWGSTTNSLTIGDETTSRAEPFYIALRLEGPEPGYESTSIRRVYIIYSENDYDGDGVSNEDDPAPLDPGEY